MKLTRFFTIIISLSLLTCTSMKDKTNRNNHDPISWEKVDSLSKKGLYRSAWDEVNLIGVKAERNNDLVNQVKVLFHQLQFSQQMDEGAELKGIDEIEKQILSAKEPLKSILHSIVAQQYWGYYQRNRHKIINRAEISSEVPVDKELWSAVNFIDKINEHYEASCGQYEVLKGKLLKDIGDEFFEKPLDKSFNRRVSLYDFLANNALDFYSNSEAGLTRPNDFFSIDKAAYFSTRPSFMIMELEEKNKTSFDYKTVKLFQELLSYYKSVTAIDALLDMDNRRLNWVHNKSNLKDKDNLLIEALDDLATQYPSSNVSAEIVHAKARIIYQQGSQYDPLMEAEDLRWKSKEALKICEKVIADYPESRGTIMCMNLKSEILQPALSTRNELVVLPNTGSMVRIEYKNVAKLYVRIIETNWNQNQNYNDQEQRFQNLFSKPVLHEWSIDLKASEDFQSHTTEILLPSLDARHYTVLLSTQPTYKSKETLASYNDFWVSHIGVVKQDNQGESVFRVLNRLSGEELKDAEVEQYEVVNDRRGNVQGWEMIENYTCDKNGEFETVNFEGYKQYYLKIKWNGEEIIMPHYSGGRYKEQKSDTFETHFFMDRGIYRPGQTIHFKAIVLHRKGAEVNIAKNFNTTVILRDANYQEAASLSLTTNDYGTVNGTFVVPNNGLTGSMSLQDDRGSKSFRVEEYKRPKFKVEIDPIQGSYKLGETIKVEGSAITFSGANLQDAEVKYTVYRRPQVKYFQWWNRCYIPPYAYSENVKIVNGIINTDEKGKYDFTFEALDGGDGGQPWLKFYNYDINITITDVNGETQVSNTVVNVGPEALILDLTIPDKVNIKEKHEFKIVTTNLNGEALNTSGVITLYRLKSPGEVKVDRYWNVTDQLNYTEDELSKAISFMSFPGTQDKTTWSREKLGAFTFDTKVEDGLSEQLLEKLNDGEFLLTIEAKDSFGKEVKNEKYFTSYNPESRSVFSYQPFEVINVKSAYLPGDELQLLLNTALEDLRVKVEVEHAERIIKKEYILLASGKKTFTYPVKSDMQGGFAVHISGYKNNRYFSETIEVNVPRIDKELTLSLETFRDKMLPGSKEAWKIKVKANNGDKVVSEVLLNMYDASLDQFVVNSRSFQPFRNHYSRLQWNMIMSEVEYGNSNYIHHKYHPVQEINYPILNRYNYHNQMGYYGRGDVMQLASMSNADMEEADGAIMRRSPPAPKEGRMKSKTINVSKPKPDSGGSEAVLSPRTNFNETAFFYPDLLTDKDGNLVFEFTLPESLTSWRFQAFAHSKTLQYGMVEAEMISQKDLMVVPNMPRFLRKGDRIMLSTKIVNVSEKDLMVTAGIKLFDAFTMQEITKEFISGDSETSLKIEAKGQDLISWNLSVNDKYEAVTWQVYAKSSTHSDAEENSLPILTNRSLVTETLPFALTNKKELNLSFDKLKNTTSTTLKHHSLTLEYNGNPVWYAVQAMPYMMEYPHDCAEQIFTRYYANSLSSHIMKSRPQIQQVIENWKQFSPDSFLSKLDKNQELKSIVLEESPWVLQSKDETERKKRLALLLDLNHMASQRSKASKQLQESQLSSGAWPWFKGMQPNLYITQHILSGFGHLDKLGVALQRDEESMIMRGLDYVDKEHLRRYREMKRHGWDDNSNHVGTFEVQYLYARSFFPDQNFRSDREAYNHYSKQIKNHWLEYNTYIKGMIALVLYRQGETAVAQDILKSLLETSIQSEALGMYWKKDVYSWNWYEPSTEKHALLIEAFSEINQDKAAVNSLKTWLIMNKRTNDWKTTKATAEACYALLLQGSDWTEPTSYVITVGEEKIDSADPDLNKEAGTGYVKKVWREKEVKSSMADITINKTGDSPSWGAVYWQYFEDLDKITGAESPLLIHKELYVVTESPTGEKLVPITSSKIKIGDRIRVRLDITTDRNMDYVHIKDLRASAFEPVDVLSRYTYQGGLGYYQSTRDSGTHFFIDRLRKGTYVLDYDLFVSHAGDMSNGHALIECMYAPEFASHSAGVRVLVGE